MHVFSTVPFEPTNSSFRMGVEDHAAPLPVSSSTSSARRSGMSLDINHSSHVSIETSFLNVQPEAMHSMQVPVFPSQSVRNQRRRERHRQHQIAKANRQRDQRRRMLWNKHQREERIATLQHEEQNLVPRILVEAVPGHVRIGSINMEKSNPEKLENLVHLAAQRGWEVTVVSECAPTSRHARLQFAGFKYWKWEQWEFIHTGQVGILLNPVWSHAWHASKGRKHRSDSGRVCTFELPRDPAVDSPDFQARWLLTGVWAPISTAPQTDLDDFWDDVATAGQCAFWHMSPHVPHVIAGDFNSQVFEEDLSDDRLPSNPVLGQYKPPHRHQLDTYVLEKIMAIEGDWVHADSFRPAIGNRHRCTWFSSIHRKHYEIDWMILARRHLRRLVSFTMRHVTAPLNTQHSAKEYVFRLEQRGGRPMPRPVARPDLTVLRGNTDAAKEARATLAAEVRANLPTPEDPATAQPGVSFSQFRDTVAQATMKICGPARRSCRKPWLRTARAEARMRPLVQECNDLRRQTRTVQHDMDESGDPDGTRQETIQQLRARHAQLKTQQRQLERGLEKDYWEGILASHPNMEADPFQFFHTLKHIQSGGKHKAARMNPFAPEEWKDHFEHISSAEEFLTTELLDFIATLPVPNDIRQASLALDDPLTDLEIDKAVRGLRSGAGGGDGVPPVVLKALYADNQLALDIRHFVRLLWTTPADCWQAAGLDGPGLQVPLWKQKEPFHSMDKWRGVVLLWVIPRVLARIVNSRGQSWFESSPLPPPESFGFRRGLGCDDALFMVRRLDEEISAWQSFGWQGTTYTAGLMDLQKAYPTANKKPFWEILYHHGLNPNGPFINALKGFHCHREYCVKTGPDCSPASLSSPYKPVRGFGEGDGTSPWSWNVLYSVILRFAQHARRSNAARRNLACGIPWRYQVPLNLHSTWTRKNDGRQVETCMVENTVFADDTTLHGSHQELHESDALGPCGMDVFSQAISKWGSTEHQGKRERYVFGSNADTCLVGGGIGPSTAVNRNIQRGLKCWHKLRPALKGSRLSHKQLGRILMAFVYAPLAYSAKTRATRQRDITRMQSVFNTACRYVCRIRLPQMRAQGINHNDLRVKLGVPPLSAAFARDQMRWLGHISRMPADTSRTYTKQFASGTIQVGEFQRTAPSAGGRISADRRCLPEVWVNLCRAHGFHESELDDKASDRHAWNQLIDQGFRQALYQDAQESHAHKHAYVNPGLQPWQAPAGHRERSPTAHEQRLAAQRQRRAQAKAKPKAAPKAAPAAGRAAAAKPLPRQVKRAQQGKTYYAGYDQKRVTAAERDAWEFVCDHPGCNLKFQTERALRIHVTKANKPGGTHTLL